MVSRSRSAAPFITPPAFGSNRHRLDREGVKLAAHNRLDKPANPRTRLPIQATTLPWCKGLEWIPVKDIFLPVVRFAAHLFATTLGFLFLLLAVVATFYGIEYIVPAELRELMGGRALQFVEISLLYIDIGLYALAVFVWTIEFIVELVSAMIRLFRGTNGHSS
jgi:hypothetical protein